MWDENRDGGGEIRGCGQRYRGVSGLAGPTQDGVVQGAAFISVASRWIEKPQRGMCHPQ